MRVWLVRACIGLLLVALGVALGAGPLQLSSRERDRELDAQKEVVSRAEARIDDLTSAQSFASDYASATARELLDGTLRGRTVGMLRLPGADEETGSSLRASLQLAGADVVSDITLAESLTGPGSRQLVEALTSQMATQEKVSVPKSAAGYERFGILLARAIGAESDSGAGGARADQAAVGIVSGLQTAELLVVQENARRASITVVLGAAPGDASHAIELAILKGFAARTRMVLAAPTSAATARGLLGVIRADSDAAEKISGVDSVETPMGRVATVLAVVARVRGNIGQYGANAEDGPVPPIR